MNYMTVKEAALAWNITERRVRRLCQSGRIEGALRNGWAYMIPKQPKPGDARTLRHLKNRSLHTGVQDFRALDECRQTFKGRHANIIEFAAFGCRLEGFHLSESDITYIANGTLVEHISLRDHLLVLNLLEALRLIQNAGDVSIRPCEQQLRDFKAMLIHHRSKIQDVHYRVPQEKDDRSVPSLHVSQKLEILFAQLEQEWRHLHPVAAASFLLVEIVRIAPFEEDNYLLALLMAAAHLMSNHYALPFFFLEEAEQLMAAIRGSFSRGNCNAVVVLLNDALMRAYHTNC